MFSVRKPTELFRHKGLYIGPAGKKGHGVFCREDLKAGETIEVVPVLMFTGDETLKLADTQLQEFIFPPKQEARALCKRSRIPDHMKATFVLMGAMTWCNHRRAANAKLAFTDGFHTGYYTLSALQDIAKDTEICLDFGPAWFEGAYPDAYTRGEKE